MNTFFTVSAATVLSFFVLSNAHGATLHEALAHAWAQQNDQYEARGVQLAAQLASSRAWTPEPPSLSIAHTNDQLTGNLGRRESELSLAIPLWLPRQRDRALAVANAEQSAFSTQTQLARWQLAGQIREAWWAVRFAQLDRDNASRNLEAAQRIAADVARRVGAGDLALIDGNRADSALQTARKDLGTANLALVEAQLAFAAATRDANLPDQDEVPGIEPPLSEHPVLQNLAANDRSAQARWKQAAVATRDAPELELGYATEKGARGEPYRGRIKLALRIPLGTDARNQPRITAAHADWIEAQNRFQQEQARIGAEIAAAKSAMHQSSEAIALADELLKLASERATWIAKGFRLGQFDLATLIRSEQEKLDADTELSRARLSAARAISRYNQTIGSMP